MKYLYQITDMAGISTNYLSQFLLSLYIFLISLMWARGKNEKNASTMFYGSRLFQQAVLVLHIKKKFDIEPLLNKDIMPKSFWGQIRLKILGVVFTSTFSPEQHINNFIAM